MAKRRITKKRSVPYRQNNNSLFSNKIFQRLLLIGTVTLAIYIFQDNLARYLGFKSDKIHADLAEAKEISDSRNSRILGLHEDKIIGADVSEYQGKIDWDNFGEVESYDVGFVFVRATVGRNRVDN